MKFLNLRNVGIAVVVLLVLAVVVGAVTSGGDDDDGGSAGGGGGAGESASSDEPIIIGMSIAQSGLLAQSDGDGPPAFEIGMEEINADGGIMGRQVEIEVLDNRSDRATNVRNTEALIDRGASVIITTADFDYGGPAARVAGQHGVPVFPYIADDPRVADARTLGPTTFSMGAGTDVEGAGMAEWSFENLGKRAYLLRDNSFQYTKTLADYFTMRFEDLGGTIAGEALFTGGENVDVSSQVTKLRAAQGEYDFIVLPSFFPPLATVVRQIRTAGLQQPIASPGMHDGLTLQEIAGKVDNYYSNVNACMPNYCDGPSNPQLESLVEKFTEETGREPAASYFVPGYDLAYVVKAAIEQAESTEGQDVTDALESLEPVDTLSGPITFTPNCHKPIREVPVVKVTDGRSEYIETYTVQKIPTLPYLKYNPCADLVNEGSDEN